MNKQQLYKLLFSGLIMSLGMTSFISISVAAQNPHDIYLAAKSEPDRDRDRDRDRLRDKSCEDRVQELKDDCDKLRERDKDRDRDRDREKDKDGNR